MRPTLTACAIAVLLAGCGSGKPVPLQDAINGLNRQLIASNILSPDDVANDQDRERLRSAMQATQKQYCLRNPSVMLLLKDFDLKLEGTFSREADLGVEQIGPAPAGSVSFKLSTSQTQTLDVPVTVTSLSNMPRVYEAYLLANVKDSPFAKQEGADIHKQSTALRALVAEVIQAYQDNLPSPECKQLLQQFTSTGVAHPYDAVKRLNLQRTNPTLLQNLPTQ